MDGHVTKAIKNNQTTDLDNKETKELPSQQREPHLNKKGVQKQRGRGREEKQQRDREKEAEGNIGS